MLFILYESMVVWYRERWDDCSPVLRVISPTQGSRTTPGAAGDDSDGVLCRCQCRLAGGRQVAPQANSEERTMTGSLHTLLLDLNDLEVLPDGNETDEGSNEAEDDCPEGVFCHCPGMSNGG